MLNNKWFKLSFLLNAFLMGGNLGALELPLLIPDFGFGISGEPAQDYCVPSDNPIKNKDHPVCIVDKNLNGPVFSKAAEVACEIIRKQEGGGLISNVQSYLDNFTITDAKDIAPRFSGDLFCYCFYKDHLEGKAHPSDCQKKEFYNNLISEDLKSTDNHKFDDKFTSSLSKSYGLRLAISGKRNSMLNDSFNTLLGKYKEDKEGLKIEPIDQQGVDPQQESPNGKIFKVKIGDLEPKTIYSPKVVFSQSCNPSRLRIDNIFRDSGSSCNKKENINKLNTSKFNSDTITSLTSNFDNTNGTLSEAALILENKGASEQVIDYITDIGTADTYTTVAKGEDNTGALIETGVFTKRNRGFLEKILIGNENDSKKDTKRKISSNTAKICQSQYKTLANIDLDKKEDVEKFVKEVNLDGLGYGMFRFIADNLDSICKKASEFRKERNDLLRSSKNRVEREIHIKALKDYYTYDIFSFASRKGCDDVIDTVRDYCALGSSICQESNPILNSAFYCKDKENDIKPKNCKPIKSLEKRASDSLDEIDRNSSLIKKWGKFRNKSGALVPITSHPTFFKSLSTTQDQRISSNRNLEPSSDEPFGPSLPPSGNNDSSRNTPTSQTPIGPARTIPPANIIRSRPIPTVYQESISEQARNNEDLGGLREELSEVIRDGLSSINNSPENSQARQVATDETATKLQELASKITALEERNKTLEEELARQNVSSSSAGSRNENNSPVNNENGQINAAAASGANNSPESASRGRGSSNNNVAAGPAAASKDGQALLAQLNRISGASGGQASQEQYRNALTTLARVQQIQNEGQEAWRKIQSNQSNKKIYSLEEIQALTSQEGLELYERHKDQYNGLVLAYKDNGDVVSLLPSFTKDGGVMYEGKSILTIGNAPGNRPEKLALATSQRIKNIQNQDKAKNPGKKTIKASTVAARIPASSIVKKLPSPSEKDNGRSRIEALNKALSGQSQREVRDLLGLLNTSLDQAK